MSRTIYKYTLEIVDNQSIEVPTGAEFLTVQIQHGKLCVWAIVDPSRRTEFEHFFIVGTGHPIPSLETLQHLGTVQLAGGSLVWHVFRAIKS
jgi:hypothetical protein